MENKVKTKNTINEGTCRLPEAVYRRMSGAQKKRYYKYVSQGLSSEEAFEKSKASNPQVPEEPKPERPCHPDCTMSKEEIQKMALFLPNVKLRNKFKYLTMFKGLDPDELMTEMLSDPEVKGIIDDLELTGCAPQIPEKFKKNMQRASGGKQARPKAGRGGLPNQGTSCRPPRKGPPGNASGPPGADHSFKQQCERLISNMNSFGGVVPLAVQGMSDMDWDGESNRDQRNSGHSGTPMRGVADLPVDGPLKEQYERLLTNVNKIGGFSNIEFGGSYQNNQGSSGMPPSEPGPSRQKRKNFDEQRTQPKKGKFVGERGFSHGFVHDDCGNAPQRGPMPPSRNTNARPAVKKQVPGPSREDIGNAHPAGSATPFKRPASEERPGPQLTGRTQPRQGNQKPHGMVPTSRNAPNGPAYGDRPQGNMVPFNDGRRSDVPPIGGGPQGNMRGFNNGPQGNMPRFNSGPQGNMPRFNSGPQGSMPRFNDGPHGNMPPVDSGPQRNIPRFNNGPHGKMPPVDIGPQRNIPRFNNGPQGNMPAFNEGPRGNMAPFIRGPQGNMPLNNGPRGNMQPFSNGPQGPMPPFNNEPHDNRPPFGSGPQGNIAMVNDGRQGNMSSFNYGPQGNMAPPFNGGPQGNMMPFNVVSHGSNMPPFSNAPKGNFPPVNDGARGNMPPPFHGNIPPSNPRFVSGGSGIPPAASPGPPNRSRDENNLVDGGPKAPLYIVPARYPSERFSEEQMDAIENAILDAILEIDDERLKPTFQESFRNNGRYGVICNDQLSMNWLFCYLSRCRPWPYASFKIISAVHSKIKAEAVLPLCKCDDNDKILKFITKQNTKLITSQWEVIQRVDGVSNTTLSLGIDEESASVLRESGTINFKMGRAEIIVEGGSKAEQSSGPRRAEGSMLGGSNPDRENPGVGLQVHEPRVDMTGRFSGERPGRFNQPEPFGPPREMVQLPTPPPPPALGDALMLRRSPEYEPSRSDRFFRTPSPEPCVDNRERSRHSAQQASPLHVDRARPIRLPTSGGLIERDRSNRSNPAVDSRRSSERNAGRGRPSQHDSAVARSSSGPVRSHRMPTIGSSSSRPNFPSHR